MSELKVGQIIYCGPDKKIKGDTRTSYWYVFDDCPWNQNSVMLERTGGPWGRSFLKEFNHTSWDAQVMDEQGAVFVDDNDVPDRIWAALAKWRLVGAGLA